MADGWNDYSALKEHRRIALLTDGYSTPFLAKTAINLLRYRTQDMAAVIDREHRGKVAQDVFRIGGHVPIVASVRDLEDIDAIYIGIAPPGGRLPSEWRDELRSAIARKLDVVSGLHDFLQEDLDYVERARASGSRLIDVRRNTFRLTGKGANFPSRCIRIHTVGHDCSVGKMVAALEVQLALSASGHDAKFLATGQTGIMIDGDGVPIDCVVSDFVNGAAEELVRRSQDHDYLLVEGQGSLTHPAYSAVTLGLLHGCAPHGLVFCYEAGRSMVKGFDSIPIPPLEEQMRFFETAANFRHPSKFIAVAVNTRTLTPEAAAEHIRLAESRFQLPTCDVYREGPSKLVSACVALRAEILSK